MVAKIKSSSSSSSNSEQSKTENTNHEKMVRSNRRMVRCRGDSTLFESASSLIIAIELMKREMLW